MSLVRDDYVADPPVPCQVYNTALVAVHLQYPPAVHDTVCLAYSGFAPLFKDKFGTAGPQKPQNAGV